MTTLGLDYHGHPSPADVSLRAGYSVTPLRYTSETGGKAERCPVSEEEQQLLGSKCPSLQKHQCWDFYQQRKEFGLPQSDTQRIHWVYVKFFEEEENMEAKGGNWCRAHGATAAGW